MNKRNSNTIFYGIHKAAAVLTIYGTMLFMPHTAVFAANAPTVNTHTQTEIRNYMKSSGFDVNAGVSYKTDPGTTGPGYSAGQLSEKTKESALKGVNAIRYIAGLNPDVTLDNTFDQEAQAAALVYSVNGYGKDSNPHSPSKPSDMEDTLYQLGKKGAGSSNLAYGHATLNAAVLSWAKDNLGSNYKINGHRRWILNPAMGKTGFGAVGRYYAMTSVDQSAMGSQKNVVWPAQQMPVDFFSSDCSWTICTGADITDESVAVTLERKSDGKTWTFDGQTSESSNNSGYFHVEQGTKSYSGQWGDCIVFRPNGTAYQDGDSFHVTVTGTGKGDLSYDVNFFSLQDPEEIKSIHNLTVEEITDCTYNGSEQKPKVTVKDGNYILKENTDYTLSYANNMKAGKTTNTYKPTVVITGKGKYKDSVTKYFNILPKKINPTIDPIPDQEYEDGWAEPELTVKDGDVVLNCGKDYYVRYTGSAYVGTARATVICMGNYIGGNSAAYEIVPRDITKAELSVDPFPDLQFGQPTENLSYTQTFDVSYNGKVLKKNHDYVVRYDNNTETGIAKMTIIGDNNYQGKIVRYFNILPEKMDEWTLWAEEKMMYTGQPQKPKVRLDGGPLVDIGDNDGDFIIEYKNNVEPGIGTVVVTGRRNTSDQGNYIGKISTTFQIVKGDLSKAKIKIPSAAYDGTEQKPIPEVILNGDRIDPSNYTVSYENNINAGKGKVTVTGRGNCEGSLTEEFTIEPASLEGAVVVCDDAYFEGKNRPVYPKIKEVVLAGKVLDPGDYDIYSVDGNTIGTHKLTIIGKGNYKGCAYVKFELKKQQISRTIDVTDYSTCKYYGGEFNPQPYLQYYVNGNYCETLNEGKDYTVRYENNIYPGTAKVIIEGIGDYWEGTVVKTFQIVGDLNSGTNGGSDQQSSPGSISSSKDQTSPGSSTNSKEQTSSDINAGSNSSPSQGVPGSQAGAGQKNTGSTQAGNKEVKLSGTSIKKIKNVKGKKAVAVWKRNSKARGYQIQYSMKKNFKKGVKTRVIRSNATTKCTLKKLRKGIWYVRIRTYNGKRYSSWSAVKKVVIRK